MFLFLIALSLVIDPSIIVKAVVVALSRPQKIANKSGLFAIAFKSDNYMGWGVMEKRNNEPMYKNVSRISRFFKKKCFITNK